MALSPTAELNADLVVVGGGVHGCSAALHAAMRGMRTVVIEKDTVARHASGVNAGGVRRLGRHFAEVPLAQASMAIWNRIEDLLDDDCGFQRAPQIKVAESEAQFEALTARATQMRALGYDHEVTLDADALRRYLPAVAPHCVGALACLEDGFAQPYQTTFAFQRKASALGVRFLEHVRAKRVARDGAGWAVETSAGVVRAGALLNCAGAWGGEIARQLGEPVPIEAIAPMMIVTAPMPRFCDAVVGSAGRPLSFKQMANGTVVIGGGRRGRARPDANATDLRFSELRWTADAAIGVFPIMAGANVVRAWAGIEERLPDDIPVIGRSSTEENAYHAFGFSAHGFQLGPGVGAIMAELIANGETNAPLTPFAITRFRDWPAATA